MILPIRTLGDPVLKTPAKRVERFDRSLQALCDDMLETMYEAEGVGLAGPQVGISLSLFVFDDGETGPRSIANPDLLDAQGEIVTDEGCLSIPGPFYPTTRAASVRCRGRDVKGEMIEFKAEGLLARIFQHEADHLRGLLYIDRLDDEGRKAVLAELRGIELGLSEPRKKRRRTE